MRLAVLALVVGCGRVDFAVTTSPSIDDAAGDAVVDAATAFDASPVAIAQSGVFGAASVLKRVLTVDADRTQFTFASWYKSDAIGEMLLCAGATAQEQSFVWAAMTDGRLVFQHQQDSVMMADAPTEAWAYASTWVHVVISVDTAQADVADRVRIWFDGAPQVVDPGTLVDIAQDQQLYLGASGIEHTLGSKFDGGFHWTGKLADTYLIFGHALDPSVFIVGTGAGVRSIAYTGPIDNESVHFDYAVSGANVFSGLPSWTAAQVASDPNDVPY